MSNTTSSLILVVDDNKPNRELMATLISRMGHEVISKANGREALEALDTHTFDLILLDIMMPEVDGYEVLQTMRDKNLLPHTPVVVVSALSEIDSVVKCLELGAEDYLYKPINHILLQARVDACLERKNLREQELQHLQEINDTKDQFVHTVSHELKNPLALIMGYTELLIEDNVINETSQEYLLQIRYQSNRMFHLIQNLLDLGRLQRGVILNIVPTSLSALAEKCLASFKFPAEQKNLQLAYTPPSTSINIEADADQIEQVLNNLISNAIKYTPAGGHIELQLLEEENEATVLVIDNGLGIPDKALPFIFDAFYRVQNEEHYAIEGTGLGLAIAKAIIEQHHGKISVESQLGVGTSFKLVLPAYQPQ